MSLKFNGCFPVPLVVDGDMEAEQVCLDVLLDNGVKRVLGGIGMMHHKGLYLLAEKGDTVGSSHTEVLRLGVVCLDFRIAGLLLLARSGKEQDRENKG